MLKSCRHLYQIAVQLCKEAYMAWFLYSYFICPVEVRLQKQLPHVLFILCHVFHELKLNEAATF